MNFFRKTDLPTPPKNIIGNTHGLEVTRVQFNPRGGFKLTGIYSGKHAEWFVPTDTANAQVQWIRQWMIDGGFPEDADPPQRPPRIMFISNAVWKTTGAILVAVGTIWAAVAATGALYIQSGCK